ncbi:MAG: TlyA family RNA methyltransferase [Oscillospiraceae bacterium]|nr:TlyA family RNA methyltransferase [Oscillospiraceae bacterium]
MTRLDKELHGRGLAKSRSVAAELIAGGKVLVGGEVCTKAATLVSESDRLEVTEQPRYVSRGGYKLEHGLAAFGVDLRGKVCLDVGASTGGFTDCMLQHGASRVYAVDVGRGQLEESLKGDERVISLEQCDIRGFELPEKPEFTAVDVSFISVKLILPYIKSREAVVLIKPQFELGRKHKGVITDRKLAGKIAEEVAAFAGAGATKVIESPVIGGSGNREFLMYLERI